MPRGDCRATAIRRRKACENRRGPARTKQPLLHRKTRILSEAPNNREKACHKVRHEYSQRFTKLKARTRVTALMLLASGYLSLPLAAQETGQPEATSPPKAQTSNQTSSGISTEPASVPVDEIIQRFAEGEAEFKRSVTTSLTFRPSWCRRLMTMADRTVSIE